MLLLPQSEPDNRYQLEHLRGFQIPDATELNSYILKIFLLFVSCLGMSVWSIYEILQELTVAISVSLIAGSSVTYIAYRKLIRLSRLRKLSLVTEPSELLKFLQRYGNITNGTIVSIIGTQKSHITYTFNYDGIPITGQYMTHKLDKKKNGEQIKVLHWEDVIHIPILDSEEPL